MSQPDDERTLRALSALRAVVLRADSYRSRVAAHLGYSTVETQALTQLAAWGTVGQGELSRMLGLSPAATTGLIDRLSTAGLVRRDPHPDDRRRSMVSLTADGVRLLETSRTYFARSLDGFTTDELDRFERDLDRVSANLLAMDQDVTAHPGRLGEPAPTSPDTV